MIKRKIYELLAALSILVLFLYIANHNQPEPPDSYITIESDYFEEAVQVIKDHEGWHGKKHYPYIGYGHKVTKGENLNHTISEEAATDILRRDLKQKCAVFREFGADSLLLGVLAYNVGEYRLINEDGSPKTNLIRKLRKGDRDIYNEYVSFRKAGGKVIRSIEKRRITEFNLLFDKIHTKRIKSK